MNKHFAYLTQSDEADFFQKVAGEQAKSRRPVASSSITKTAMQQLLGGITFEKVAGRIDRDIGILKIAGPSGMNAGMQKRAGAYLDQLVEQCEMTDEEYGEIFDKLAAESILGDMSAAFDHLSDGLDHAYHPWLRGEIQKLGYELTVHAMHEKEAGLLSGIGKLLGRGGEMLGEAGMGAKALKAGAGRAIGRGARAVGEGASGVGRAVKGAVRGAVDKAVIGGKMIAEPFTRAGRLARTEAGLAKTEASLAKMKDLHGASPKGGVLESMRGSGAKSLEEKAVAQRAKAQRLQPKAPSPTTTKPVASKEVKAPSAPAPAKTPAGSSTAATDAAAAAKPAKATATKSEAPPIAAKSETAPPSAKAPTEKVDSSLVASDKGGVTMKGAYEKVRDQGWKALSSAEKQKLINAGIATVVGGRVVLGHGLLTGGEGII